MKKKVEMSVIDDILGGAEEPQESNGNVEKQKRASKGRPREEDYEARTFRVRKELVQKLRIISATEGLQQKDILEEALGTFIARYEKKKGAIDTSRSYGKRAVKDIFK